MTHLHIETELHPTPAQRAVLARQQETASALWRVLARQALADRHGLNLPLVTLWHGAAHSISAHVGPPVTRTKAQRLAEVRALARDLGWSRELGTASLDDLVAEFSRHVRHGEIRPDRPDDHHLLLGPLARPLWPLEVEVGGLETPVAAALYTLPAAARSAVSTWRSAFIGRLDAEWSRLLPAGHHDSGTDAALLSHLARWAHVHRTSPTSHPPPCPVVTLTLREDTRLRWDRGGSRAWLVWCFRIDDVAAPRTRGLVGADPGITNLWTAWGAASSAVFPNPMRPGSWRLPPWAGPQGDLCRPWAAELARVQRDAVLVTRLLHPAQHGAEVHLLNHEHLALEEPDLARFMQLRAEYGPWAAWSGATVQHRYIAAVARVARRVVLIPARDAATSTCSTCHARGSMRYRRRAGRCRVCGANHDRDLNAAANIYRLGLARL
ncbi:zinc ribbon domain-containing protein [Deinococcus yunweiensis]|uniref:zinc ribbon domain-containing protein n=1 Tax=Deinococcus yunweiensis TaxID=367282 RepID=UPI00398E9243